MAQHPSASRLRDSSTLQDTVSDSSTPGFGNSARKRPAGGLDFKVPVKPHEMLAAAEKINSLLPLLSSSVSAQQEAWSILLLCVDGVVAVFHADVSRSRRRECCCEKISHPHPIFTLPYNLYGLLQTLIVTLLSECPGFDASAAYRAVLRNLFDRVILPDIAQCNTDDSTLRSILLWWKSYLGLSEFLRIIFSPMQPPVMAKSDTSVASIALQYWNDFIFEKSWPTVLRRAFSEFYGQLFKQSLDSNSESPSPPSSKLHVCKCAGGAFDSSLNILHQLVQLSRAAGLAVHPEFKRIQRFVTLDMKLRIVDTLAELPLLDLLNGFLSTRQKQTLDSTQGHSLVCYTNTVEKEVLVKSRSLYEQQRDRWAQKSALEYLMSLSSLFEKERARVSATMLQHTRKKLEVRAG